MNPYLVACHITPVHHLLYSDLCHLKPLTLLPTLVPSKTILITSTLSSNYRIDNALITHPNLYISSRIVVHGIDRILDLHPQRSKMPPLLHVGNVLGAASSQTGE
ncbi:FAS1 domain-containing protein [Heracleum sosnowskyi]|uniref:FAS1 domain-containing protein n=1 Tax=Heracleum sosnowskyi TaxID=360622 RepID=A0AAD8J1C7_9APIA|nr:FAS1 domain-containing protein [Heracleum sosnowskyi]